MPPVGSAELSNEAGRVRSTSGRLVLLAVGHACVVLGVIGAFLPVMPTTVFLIVAASCYARASTKFYNRLVSHRVFGPMILDWQLHRAMSRKSKAIAIASIVVVFSATLVFFLSLTWVRVLHVSTGLALIALILSIRTRP
ncbi:MAG: YbaN family protein [Gemmatimonadales bacterium]